MSNFASYLTQGFPIIGSFLPSGRTTKLENDERFTAFTLVLIWISFIIFRFLTSPPVGAARLEFHSERRRTKERTKKGAVSRPLTTKNP